MPGPAWAWSSAARLLGGVVLLTSIDLPRPTIIVWLMVTRAWFDTLVWYSPRNASVVKKPTRGTASTSSLPVRSVFRSQCRVFASSAFGARTVTIRQPL